MERDSFLYKARRKCQVLAHKIISNEALSKMYYRIVLHKKLNHFFIANSTWYFAELTFTPGAGMMPFNPEKYDLEWGSMLDI